MKGSSSPGKSKSYVETDGQVDNYAGQGNEDGLDSLVAQNRAD